MHTNSYTGPGLTAIYVININICLQVQQRETKTMEFNLTIELILNIVPWSEDTICTVEVLKK